MAKRSLIAIISLILLAGGVLLQFFVILSGAIDSSPPNQVYFLQSTTNNIGGDPSPRNPTRWTYFALCGVNGNKNANCGSTVPALPFSPADKSNFHTTKGVPKEFVGTKYYYYMSRFAWVFFLVALLFAAFALITGLLAMCSSIGGYLSGMIVIVALFFQTMAAALTTTWVVKGRDVFKSAGQETKIGQKALGFTWAAMACFFLSTILFCIGGATGKSEKRSSRRSSSRRRGFAFGRSRSKRSRTSFDS